MVGIHRLCWGVLHNRVLKDISKRRTPVESDPTLICELLVGLGEVDVVGINDDGRGPVWSKGDRPVVWASVSGLCRAGVVQG